MTNNQNNTFTDKTKDYAKQGVDIVKDTGDVIGDAAKKAVKSVSNGISNVTSSVTKDQD